MEKYKDLFGMYVACEEGQHDEYMVLKSELESQLKEAVRQMKEYGHEGFDVGFILFRNSEAVLSCCLDYMNLWIGLYDRATERIQRYVVFDDIKDLTDAEIRRFVNVIENIVRNPGRMIGTNNIARAWQDELASMDREQSGAGKGN